MEKTNASVETRRPGDQETSQQTFGIELFHVSFLYDDVSHILIIILSKVMKPTISSEISAGLRQPRRVCQAVATAVSVFLLFMTYFHHEAQRRSDAAAALIAAHRGYQGLTVGRSGTASLWIGLMQRESGFFVRRIEVGEEEIALRREFVPVDGSGYREFIGARVDVNGTFDDAPFRARVLIGTAKIAGSAAFGSMIGAVLLVLVSFTSLSEKRRIEREFAERTARFARQVAHDIRAPLSALEQGISNFEASSDGRFVPIRLAVSRIVAIAADLSKGGRGLVPNFGTQSAGNVVASIVEEKRVQYGSRRGVTIRWDADAETDSARPVDAKEFGRILSNLIDNGVEALESTGYVKVRLEGAENGGLRIIIEDSGRGIPRKLITRLGRYGETHGKQGGTGMGLAHAREFVESLGGRFEIKSEVGKGTRIVLILPPREKPSAPLGDAALVDDDPLVRMTWTAAAKRAGSPFRAFETSEAFLASDVPIDVNVYVDWELAIASTAEGFVAELRKRGYTNILIATGREADELPTLAGVKAIVGKEPPWG